MAQPAPAAGKRKHAAAWQVIEVLLDQPVVNVNEVIRKTGIAYAVAEQSHCRSGCRLDILRPANNQRRNRAFHAHEVMNVLYTGLDKVLDQVAMLSRRS